MAWWWYKSDQRLVGESFDGEFACYIQWHAGTRGLGNPGLADPPETRLGFDYANKGDDSEKNVTEFPVSLGRLSLGWNIIPSPRTDDAGNVLGFSMPYWLSTVVLACIILFFALRRRGWIWPNHLGVTVPSSP